MELPLELQGDDRQKDSDVTCQSFLKRASGLSRRSAMPLQRTQLRAKAIKSCHLEFKLYRLHVGRSFTVFYQVCEKDKLVKILEIGTIDKGHKLYKHFDR